MAKTTFGHTEIREANTISCFQEEYLHQLHFIMCFSSTFFIRKQSRVRVFLFSFQSMSSACIDLKFKKAIKEGKKRGVERKTEGRKVEVFHTAWDYLLSPFTQMPACSEGGATDCPYFLQVQLSSQSILDICIYICNIRISFCD